MVGIGVMATLGAVAGHLIATPPLRPPAYLDPGSGSYLLQLIVAGLLGGMFVLRLSWRKVTSFFSRLFRRQREQIDDER